jgi:hypothetical protein
MSIPRTIPIEVDLLVLGAGAAGMTWLAQNTDVKLLSCGDYSDYLDEDGVAVRGRAIIPEPFDGRLLGDQFHRVRPPIAESTSPPQHLPHETDAQLLRLNQNCLL